MSFLITNLCFASLHSTTGEMFFSAAPTSTLLRHFDANLPNDFEDTHSCVVVAFICTCATLLSCYIYFWCGVFFFCCHIYILVSSMGLLCIILYQLEAQELSFSWHKLSSYRCAGRNLLIQKWRLLYTCILTLSGGIMLETMQEAFGSDSVSRFTTDY